MRKDDLEVWAGFKDGVCMAATRRDPPCRDFIDREEKRGLDIKRVQFREAIRSASPGFKKSLRMLRKSMMDEIELREAGLI